MSVSGYTPRWRRWLQRRAPWLFRVPPCGNWHWRWDRWCYCRVYCHTLDWHGGVMDLRTGRERPYTGPIRLRPLDRYGWPVVTLKGRPITNAIRFLLHTRRIGWWMPPVQKPDVNTTAFVPLGRAHEAGVR